ncbi:unnamed protein product [Ixodes hexagonus]
MTCRVLALLLRQQALSRHGRGVSVHCSKVNILHSPCVAGVRFPVKPPRRLMAPLAIGHLDIHRSFASSSDESEKKLQPVTRTDKWKHAIKEYGTTMVVFHVVLSLTSFGICYVVVSSGVDLSAIAVKLGFSIDAISLTPKMAAGGGTFVIAYAVHKIFTPVRMFITLSVAPMLVRWLRRNGILGFR